MTPVSAHGGCQSDAPRTHFGRGLAVMFLRCTRYAAALAWFVAFAGCEQAQWGSRFAGADDSGTHEEASEPIGDDDGPSPACPLLCLTGEFAVLELTCPAAVTSAEVTGPCAPIVDASISDAEAGGGGGGTGPPAFGGFGFSCAMSTRVPFTQCTEVVLAATKPGVCHVALTFEGGFAYSTDIRFTWQTLGEPPGCPNPCAPFVGPTQSRFEVDNPSTTCVDAGVDGG
jgi:hypothetical protein